MRRLACLTLLAAGFVLLQPVSLPAQSLYFPGGTASAQDTPVGWVIPTGTIDGTNAAFTLPSTPDPKTVIVTKNGVVQQAGGGADYTLSIATITFTNASLPQTGDTVLVYYWNPPGVGSSVRRRRPRTKPH